MTIYTLYTRTPSVTANRFDSKESLIWAADHEWTEVEEYGEHLWQIQVDLPLENEGKYLYTGQNWDDESLWGKKLKKVKEEWTDRVYTKEVWYVFKSSQIISRKYIGNYAIELDNYEWVGVDKESHMAHTHTISKRSYGSYVPPHLYLYKEEEFYIGKEEGYRLWIWALDGSLVLEEELDTEVESELYSVV